MKGGLSFHQKPNEPVKLYVAVAFGENMREWWAEVRRLNPADRHVLLCFTDSEGTKEFTYEQVVERLGLKP